MIYVCSLSHLHATVEACGARHVLTVMGKLDRVTRPPSIAPDNHLMIAMDDITAPADGFAAPSVGHVAQIIDFAKGWDRAAPLVIHCFAGISRSTASAFAAVCALNPERTEFELARCIRDASPSAAPNRLIVEHADALLARNGRMIAAIDAMAPPALAIEGEPFCLHID
jgi:predicted protein tyrosine phosphatase